MSGRMQITHDVTLSLKYSRFSVEIAMWKVRLFWWGMLISYGCCGVVKALRLHLLSCVLRAYLLLEQRVRESSFLLLLGLGRHVYTL